ncbi:hypothetical protein [Luteolibacter soli]|uniref:CopG family transcriptional regulator n=1 Tax=Luteolibacter soli TaxID=3135280 RepID=A0ABU9AZ19_9BACT
MPDVPALVAFEQALDHEAAAERKAAREAAKLEPITIVIADQEELRRLHELAKRHRRDTPVAMIRRHLRGWSRTELDAIRIEQRIA